MGKKHDDEPLDQVIQLPRVTPKYQIIIARPGETECIIKFVTASRSLARSAYLLAKENGLNVEVVEELAPRAIKFKGIE